MAAGQLAARTTRRKKTQKKQCICLGGELSTAKLIVASCLAATCRAPLNLQESSFKL